MPPEFTTIYSTDSIRDAHTVRDLLAAARVSAVVVRDPFDRKPSGDTSTIGVQVASADEAAARRVVGRLEQGRVHDGAEERVLDTWPRCPECEAPRIASCPVCQTAGHDFPQADFEFSVPPEFADAEEPRSCGCGGCEAEQPGGPAKASGTESETVQDDTPEPPIMLTCTTCDEPFVPRYLKRCEWCGHTFPDGIEFELPDDTPAEPLNARVTFVFITLAAAALALLAWLAYVM